MLIEVTQLLICNFVRKHACNTHKFDFLTVAKHMTVQSDNNLAIQIMSAHRGMIYQTNGKGVIYMSVHLAGEHYIVSNDLLLII